MPQIVTITHSELASSEKWLINYFLSKKTNDTYSDNNLVKLGELVSERNETIDPQKYPNWQFAYLGLENVESNTGFLVNFEKKLGKDIKSRTKVFYGGDLLYGKLRPTLNKVFYTNINFKGGISSTEFFVLKVDEKRISANVLKFLLSSDYVLSQIKSFTAGAALPRIHIDDFMNIRIPMPDPKKLAKLEERITKLNNEILKSREIYFNSRSLYKELYDSIVSTQETRSENNLKPNDLIAFLDGELPF